MRILRRHAKHSRQSFISYPNASNFVNDTPLLVLVSTLFFSVFEYPDETLSLVLDILHKTQRLQFNNHFEYFVSSGARACNALNQLEEAIKWCDEGFEVSFQNCADIQSILWLITLV